MSDKTSASSAFVSANPQTASHAAASAKNEAPGDPDHKAKVRACDCCRKRKIKCSGVKPCVQCQNVNLECTYNEVQRKMGPKRKNRVVLNALRSRPRPSTSPDSASPADPAELAAGSGDAGTCPDPRARAGYQMHGNSRYHLSLVSQQNPFSWDIIDRDSLVHCLSLYFEKQHIITPVLDPPQVYGYLHTAPTAARYSLVMAMCLVALVGDVPGSLGKHKSLMLAEAERADAAVKVPHVSIESIVAPYLMNNVYFARGDLPMAFFSLRKALTMAQLYGLHRESHYSSLGRSEDVRHRILFHTLYVTDRGLWLLSDMPYTLTKCTVALPDMTEFPLAQGILQLSRLFSVIDDINFLTGATFSRLSLADLGSYDNIQLSPAVVEESLQKLRACRAFDSWPKLQKTDFYVTRLWLKVFVWKCQARTPAGIPKDFTEDAYKICKVLTQETFATHGRGIVIKLSDILNFFIKDMNMGELSAAASDDEKIHFILNMFRDIALSNGADVATAPTGDTAADLCNPLLPNSNWARLYLNTLNTPTNLNAFANRSTLDLFGNDSEIDLATPPTSDSEGGAVARQANLSGYQLQAANAATGMFTLSSFITQDLLDSLLV